MSSLTPSSIHHHTSTVQPTPSLLQETLAEHFPTTCPTPLSLSDLDQKEPEVMEETDWDQDTMEIGVVMDYVTKTEIERRIAYPSHLLNYRTMPGDPNGFKFQKVFRDASFVASGMLEIPVGSEKPSKPTKDNTYIFIVLEGAVSVKIHETNFTIAPHGQFMVPRGNKYSITTISRQPAKLFFAQARKMAADEVDIRPWPSRTPSPCNSIPRREGSKLGLQLGLIAFLFIVAMYSLQLDYDMTRFF